MPIDRWPLILAGSFTLLLFLGMAIVARWRKRRRCNSPWLIRRLSLRCRTPDARPGAERSIEFRLPARGLLTERLMSDDSVFTEFAVWDDSASERVMLVEAYSLSKPYDDSSLFGYSGIRSEVRMPSAIDPHSNPYCTTTLNSLGYGSLLLASRSDGRKRGFHGYGNQPDDYCVVQVDGVMVVVSVWAESSRRGRRMIVDFISSLNIGERMGMVLAAA